MATPDIILSQSAGNDGQDIDTICLGSGRFLRSVLVPFLSSNSKPAVFQTRGRTFLDSFIQECKCDDDNIIINSDIVAPSLQYPVDTIQFDGSTTTSNINIHAAGTLGTHDGKCQLMDRIISNMECISVIGVGVTEAGIQSADTQCMLDLTELLYRIFCSNELKCTNPNGRICIINTDNVPNNGNVIQCHVLKNAIAKYGEEGEFVDFVSNKVAFLNSMVDRITSSRPNSNGLLPLCEPLPNKALVVCDPGHDLPLWMIDGDIQAQFGVKIRHDPSELGSDIALKLRVANGTHTAVAHAMALLGLVNTEALCNSSESSGIILNYLDSLYESQILPGAVSDGISADETNATWEDWRKRLQHPHFGLSTFFITQNGAAKCGIRLGPTIKSLVNAGHPLSVSMAFAVAAVLRFLTPDCSLDDKKSGWSEVIRDARQRGFYVGWVDGADSNIDDHPVTYADGLRYNLKEGWYEFRSDCRVFPIDCKNMDVVLSDELIRLRHEADDPYVCIRMVRSYLLSSQGGNLQSLLKGNNEEEELSRRKMLDIFVGAVSTLYARMACGDTPLVLLKEMAEKQNMYENGFATTCSCLGEEMI